MQKPQYYDSECDAQNSTDQVTLTVGANFQPGDLRICMISFYRQAGFSAGAIAAPAGWTQKQAFAISSGNQFNGAVFTQILSNTSVDTLLPYSGDWYYFTFTTVRNWNPANPPLYSSIQSGTSATSTALSVSAQSDVLFNWSLGSYHILSGWTPITITDNSGANYTGVEPGAMLIGQSFPSAATIPATAPPGTPAYGWWYSVRIPWLTDITVNVGTAVAESDLANAVTGTRQNLVTFPVQTAVQELDLAYQVFSPLTGIHTRTPKVLTGNPVAGSRVSWSYDVYAPGSTVIVETSVDNGLTWQLATLNGPVPNLEAGNTSCKAVLSRATITRAKLADPTPRLHFLEVDVTCDDSTDEMVSLGVFLIDEVEINIVGGTTGGGGGSSGGGDGVTGDGGGNSGGGLTLTVSGTDLSLAISRSAWTDVYYIPYGTRSSDAIMAMIKNRLPDAQFNFASTEHVLPQLIYGTSQGNDPWQDAMDLAQAIGFELFFDANGICTLRPVPDPTQGTPLWEFNDGMNPTVVAVDRILSEQTTYNYIVVTGETSSNTAPVYAIAQDTNPSSPTYIGGSYGIKPYYWQSSEVTTTDQAQAAANALLRLSMGAADNTTLTVVPMPAIEPGDIVAVNITESKNNGNYLVNSVTTSLSAAEAQQLVVYRQGQGR